MSTHLAAMFTGPGQPFQIKARTTPTPGPDDLLIAVKSIALNPADHLIGTHGLFIKDYPTVIGFDISGLVLAIGSNVPTGTTSSDDLHFEAGVTRVACYTASFWRDWNPNYGAFQQRVLVPWQHAVPLPAGLGWNDAATLPVAVQVPLCAWDTSGVLRRSALKQGQGQNGQKEALLIWGASSSIGTMGVQSARLIKEDTANTFVAVYATAGAANLKYVQSLGADRVFDYSDAEVVKQIVEVARKDDVVVRKCFLATGELAKCQAALKAFIAEGERSDGTLARIASAPVVPEDAEVVQGVETTFLIPAAEEEERSKQFEDWMGTWLREKLQSGLIKPSPPLSVVGRGLEAVYAGLKLLKEGVSCTKLVIEVED
jgi:NADPH:quinone reductase-like Zn-dependent oxidoreductase